MSSIITSTFDDLGKEGAYYAFLGESKQLRLNDLQLLSCPQAPRYDAPWLTIGVIFAAALLLLLSYMNAEGPNTFGQLGTILIFLTLLIFPVERTIRRKKVRRLMDFVRPLVDDLGEIQHGLSTYLSDLDKRTSRYFHCVTNTKVTTYFMLRQIEAALAEAYNSLDAYLEQPVARNYDVALHRLRGNLQYRDGFEFNSGELHEVPMTRIAQQVQELIQNLESGIEALEDEINHSRRLAEEQAKHKDDGLS